MPQTLSKRVIALNHKRFDFAQESDFTPVGPALPFSAAAAFDFFD
jgi:hypothetical protein